MKDKLIKLFIIIFFLSINAPAQVTPQLSIDLSTMATKVIILRDKKILELYSGDSLLKTFKVAVGKKKTPTPTGKFHIVNKVKNPTWYPKGKEPIEPGKDNPVGSRWMGLDIKGYGIHGTNAPGSIGKPVSHGCIRMEKKDVETLFQMVSVGTSVLITDSTALHHNPDGVQLASSKQIPSGLDNSHLNNNTN